MYTLETESGSDAESTANVPKGVGITITFGVKIDDKARATLFPLSSVFSDKWIPHDILCSLSPTWRYK